MLAPTCVTPIAKQLERLARVRDVVGRPAGKDEPRRDDRFDRFDRAVSREIHFVEDEKGGVVGAFAPSAVAVARALYAPTDAEHDAARAALAAGVVDDWTRGPDASGPVHAPGDAIPARRRARRVVQASEVSRTFWFLEGSGFGRAGVDRGGVGVDAGFGGWGARAAIDLYYSTQMRLLRDVMAGVERRRGGCGGWGGDDGGGGWGAEAEATGERAGRWRFGINARVLE